jgi:hypothetical protein
MDTTNIVSALNIVFNDSTVQSSFNTGLYLGATIVGTLLAFSLLRTIPGDGHEEL